MHFRRVPFWGLAVLVLCAAQAGYGQLTTITLVGGNGQLVQQGFTAGEPLIVLVKDASTGAPLANQVVNWAVTSGAGTGTVFDAQTVTDATGQTSTKFSGQGVFPGFFTAYVQGTVTATTATGAAVSFTESVALSDIASGVVQVTASIVSGDSGLTGGVGSQGATPIQISVRSIQTQQGVPNVSLHLTGTDPASGPSISCAGGTPAGTTYTDASGIANCFPMFLGKIGTGVTTIVVGGGFTTFQREFQVTVGPPGLIKIIQGDNQQGNTGQTLPTPLLAVVADIAGNPLGGIPVTFEPVVPGTATVSNIRSPSGNDGRVSATVTLGQTPGAVQIRVRTTDGSNASGIFNLTAVQNVTALQKLSGEPQEAIVNTAFAQPLIVQVNNQGQPVPNAQVQFTVSSGSALVGNPPSSTTATASTDASGQAKVSVQAGASAGTVVITASIGTFSVTFTLTVRPPGPSVTTSSFYNAAGLQQLTAVAPCGLVQIIASGLAPGVQGTITASTLYIGPLPYQIASVNVQFGTNDYAPLFAVSHVGIQESVTLEVPCDLKPGVVPVTVTVAGASATVNMPVAAYAPGIFETAMSDGKNRAVVFRPDGSWATLQNPSRGGEILRVYVAGLGNPGGLATNLPVTDDVTLTLPVVIGVNNQGVRVVSVKPARNLVGVYEVSFELPSDVGTGDNVPFAIGLMADNGTITFGNPSSLVIH